MLSLADAGVAQRDHRLPGLSLVLDPEALVGWLATTLHGTWITGAEASHVNYAPGDFCVVAYTFKAPGGCLDGVAKAYRPDAPAAAFAADSVGPSVFGGPGAATSPERGVSVAFFPNDRRLPTLRRLGDRQRRRAILTRVLGAGRAAEVTRVQPLRYTPERSWVGIAHDARGPSSVLRLYAAGALPPRFPDAKGAPHVPLALGRDERARAVAVSWLRGRPLAALLTAAHTVAPLGEVGRALSRVHVSAVEGLPHRSRERETRTVRAAGTALAHLLPDAASRVQDLVEEITVRLYELPTAIVTLHGDFTPAHVVVGADGVGLVDLDAVGVGDPAIDLGRFAAALHIAQQQTRPADADGVLAAVLDGYRPDAATVGRMRAHTAASLLRSAIDPFRVRAPDWPARSAAIVDRAQALLTAC